MTIWEPIVSFYEDLASSTRSIFKDYGLGMLDFIVRLQQAPEINVQGFYIDHMSLGMKFEACFQMINVGWNSPDKYDIWVERHSDDPESFYDDHTTASLDEIIETIKEYRGKVA